MSKVTKNGFSHFRCRFEAFQKPRVPTGLRNRLHFVSSISCILSELVNTMTGDPLFIEKQPF